MPDSSVRDDDLRRRLQDAVPAADPAPWPTVNRAAERRVRRRRTLVGVGVAAVAALVAVPLVGRGDDGPDPVVTTTPTTVATTLPPPTTIDLTTTRVIPEVGTTLRGDLLDGDEFVIRVSAEDGLCLLLGAEDYGCDTGGPVAPVGSPQPRYALDPDASSTEDSVLLFGYLPGGVATVEGRSATGAPAGGSTVVTDGIWAIPVDWETPLLHPDRLVYLDHHGRPVAAWDVRQYEPIPPPTPG